MFNCREADVEITFDFLEKMLTERGIEEGSLHPSQYVKINYIDIDNENNIFAMNCDICFEQFN